MLKMWREVAVGSILCPNMKASSKMSCLAMYSQLKAEKKTEKSAFCNIFVLCNEHFLRNISLTCFLCFDYMQCHSIYVHVVLYINICVSILMSNYGDIQQERLLAYTLLKLYLELSHTAVIYLIVSASLVLMASCFRLF